MRLFGRHCRNLFCFHQVYSAVVTDVVLRGRSRRSVSAYVLITALHPHRSKQIEPEAATLQEAVLESGFNSRQAYYSVKRK